MAKDPTRIESSCPQCGEMLLFPERHRGMKGRCPGCSFVFTIGEYVYRAAYDGELTIADENDRGRSSGKSETAGFEAAETDRVRSERLKNAESKPPPASKTPAPAHQPMKSAAPAPVPVLMPVPTPANPSPQVPTLVPVVGVPLMAVPTANQATGAWSMGPQGHAAWFGNAPAANVPPLIPVAWPGAATPTLTPVQPALAAQHASSGELSVHDARSANEALANAFSDKVARRPFPFGQRVGLLFNAMLAMLPVVGYVLLLAGALALLVWHAVDNAFLIPDVKLGFTLLWLVTFPLYLLGIGLFLGMTWLLGKHLFAPRKAPPELPVVPRAEAERLYHWAERIAESIGAPKPVAVVLDGSIDPAFEYAPRRGNSPAGFRLRIGAPLIASTSLPQLTTLVAQEMGRRVGGEAPSCRATIHNIWRWFGARANEPDLWDERSEKLARELEGVSAIYHRAKVVGAAIVRRVFGLFEWLAAEIAAPVVRRWTLDADHYAIRLTGSPVFEHTIRRLRVIRSAWRATLEQARQDRADGKPVPNLPKVLADNLKRMPPQVEAQLAATADQHQVERYDVFPSDRERIAAARATQAGGLFHVDLPARSLFDDFDSWSRKVTRQSAVEYYGAELAGDTQEEGSDVSTSGNDPIQTTPNELSTMARDQFFSHAPMAMRAWHPISGNVGPARPLPELINTLVGTRTTVRQQKPVHKQIYQQWAGARVTVWEGEAATLLMSRNLPLVGTPLAGRVAHYQAACDLLDRGRIAEANMDQQLLAFEKIAAGRMFVAFQAFNDAGVRARLGDGDQRLSRVRSLLDLQLRIAQHLPRMHQAQQQLALLNLLHSVAARNGVPIPASQTLEQRQAIAEESTRCRDAFGELEYPYPSTIAGLTLAEYLLPSAILPRITMESIAAIGRMTDRLQGLHDRIVNELCGNALDIETILGIK